MGVMLNTDQRALRKLLLTYAEWYEYVLLTSEPSDWDTHYTDYYTKSGKNYVPVPAGSGAPTFATSTYYSAVPQRELCGKRVADSSIENNNTVNKTKDVTGKVWTDIDNVEPQQSFDAFPVLGGSKFGQYLSRATLEADTDKYNGVFNVYVIAAYDDYDVANSYFATKDVNCTVEVSRFGGSDYVDMDYIVHYSLDRTLGTVDKLTSDFAFTPKS